MKCPPIARRPAPRRHQRGIALVELAIVLVPLVLLLGATADLGRAFYTFDTLTKAARNAARYLTLGDPTDATRQSNAINLVLYGNTNGSGTKLVADLNASQVAICTLASCASDHAAQVNGAAVMNLVSVRISGYAYTSLFSAALPATLGFHDISVTMRQLP